MTSLMVQPLLAAFQYKTHKGPPEKNPVVNIECSKKRLQPRRLGQSNRGGTHIVLW